MIFNLQPLLELEINGKKVDDKDNDDYTAE